MAKGEHGRAASEHEGAEGEHEGASREHGRAEGEHVDETGVSGGAKGRDLSQRMVTCCPQFGAHLCFCSRRIAYDIEKSPRLVCQTSQIFLPIVLLLFVRQSASRGGPASRQQ